MVDIFVCVSCYSIVLDYYWFIIEIAIIYRSSSFLAT